MECPLVLRKAYDEAVQDCSGSGETKLVSTDAVLFLVLGLRYPCLQQRSK